MTSCPMESRVQQDSGFSAGESEDNSYLVAPLMKIDDCVMCGL